MTVFECTFGMHEKVEYYLQVRFHQLECGHCNSLILIGFHDLLPLTRKIK